MMRRSAMLALVLAISSSTAMAADPTPEQAAFFETKVRPLLVNNCQDCHGEDDANGNLRLDSLGAILGGGDSGPAVVPGKPNESLLVRATSYADAQLQMPPDNKLSDAELAVLKEWVAMGAPWPGADPAATPQAPRKEFQITEEDRTWWAFQPLNAGANAERGTGNSDLGTGNSERGTGKNGEREDRSDPLVPRSAFRVPSFTASSIDELIRAKLGAKGITPNGLASKRVLIRRATFDLIGLPPTPEEVEAFVADTSPDAYAQLIDRLLASPHYGERWARYWLDVVRYAQTNGYERDDEKPEAWRYRDYVVRAFNEDKPYDQFVREQLAGDEMLANAERGTGNAERGTGNAELKDAHSSSVPSSEFRVPSSFDPLIATGFYRLGVWDDEPDDKRMAEFDDLDDIVTTTSHAFLGLTINCARCHDHKFDPIAQADYYSLLAFFRNVRRYEPPRKTPDSPTMAPLAPPEAIAHRQSEKPYAVAQVQAAIQEEADQERKKELSRYKESIERKEISTDWALVVAEGGANAPPTHVLARGNSATPTDEVSPAFPQILAAEKPTIPAPAAGAKSTGRRSVLADWIANPANPLTARVMVNRIWQHHFGRGIVPTPNDFGRTGIRPTHPELLDWLAQAFISGGWSTKHMHRTIMLSETYQRSSGTENELALAADESNSLYWRQNLRRVEAEVMRDSMLAVSGQLDKTVGGPSVFVTLPPEVLATQSRPGSGWRTSPAEQQRRRSIYVFVKRSLLLPLLENFDYSNTAYSMGERPTTTIAPQALMLLNSNFVREQAAALADRVTREAGDDPAAQIEQVFRLTLQRLPSGEERTIAAGVFENQRRANINLLALESGSRDPVTDAAEARKRSLRSLCLMMLNLNEFLYID